MGKILEYSNLGAPPADNDLLFMGDYSANTSNPTTMRLTIADLNKKRNVDAADANGLVLRDDSSTYGIKIHDGGNVGVGPGAATAPGAYLSVRGASDANLTLVNILNPSATTDGRYSQIIFGTDAANDKSVVFRYYYSTTDDASALRIQSYEDAAAENQIGLHLKGGGNVGVGVADPAANLDVAGDFRILHGTHGVAIDASNADIHGLKGSGSASGPLHLNRNAGEDIWFMYGDGTDFAGKIESTNKRWSIGAKSSAGARLHVYESSGADNVALKLENRVASGSPNSILRFTRTVGSTSLEQQMVWDGTNLGIRNVSAVALGSDSVNFRAGSLDVGATGFTRKFNVTDSNNIVSEFNCSSPVGTRILIRNTADADASVQNSLIAFPNNIGGTEYANWMIGTHKDNSNPDNNYFMIHRSSQASPTAGQYIFNATTTANEMRLDTSGNVRFKGTMEASAYYDQGGNTAGNYCRGRFVQTFSVPYYADVNNRFSPLLAAPFDRTGDTSGSTITAKWASIAPHDGRIQSIRASAKNNASDQTNMTVFVYTGANLPSGTELSTSDSAYVKGYDSGAPTSNSQLHLAADANQKVTLGYSNFAGSNAGGQSNLDFSQGDYLMFSFDCDSGNANLNVQFTVEFYMDDTL